ncbi:MAG: glycosyltransferase, partial [Bacteroidota bacterium]
MSSKQQIFQTSSKLRWYAFKWVGRLVLFFLLLMIPVIWIAMSYDSIPMLPGLSKEGYEKIHPVQMKGFSKREKRKYRGYEDFLKEKKQNTLLTASEKKKTTTSRIRAAFYVDWDPQAFYSLQNHISKLNTVMPEWFFIDPKTDTLISSIDQDAYKLMKKHGIRILPMLENVNLTNHDGSFDGKLLANVLTNKAKRERLLNDIETILEKDTLQGINIDFEELQANTIEAMHAFQKELYERLHKKGLLVTQDIMPEDEDFHLKELGACNDYLFIMAYDQHYSSSEPGPVSEQRWVEKELDEVAKVVPPGKIILGMAAYGYDWPDGDKAETITYQQALSLSKEFNAAIDFNNDSYNCSFEYTDYDKIHHKVSFLDAGGNFNTMRFADEYGTAGVALWRLGSEDERLWDFYNRDLSNEAMIKEPFDFSILGHTDVVTGEPDYNGDGEILDVKNGPQNGIIDIERDSVEDIISEETYRQLPTRYFIKRFGQVHNEVILTFDDGPDPDYTPRILDILKREKVPAAFFVVGMNAEAHLPILKRIYHEGFEIGNHTFTHPNIAAVSERRAQTEIEATRLLIEAATGRSTILFRAPYNADAEPTRAVELKPLLRSKLEGYYTVGESIDPDDWDIEHGTNADSIYNRVVRLYESHPDKGIILFHDAGGNRNATVEALPRIIHYFKNKKIKFTTVANLLGVSKDIIMPPVHNELVNINGWVDIFIYWTGRFLFAAFWVAIVLGLVKIFLMGILATLDYFKTKKEVFAAGTILPGKVSIIVPAYNEEINAIKTVKNLLMQDYPDYEIIFIDDGSTDNTYKNVTDAFKNNERVKVFTKPNGGKASALNKGISHAIGDYVVCIDADTLLMPDGVRQMMKYFSLPGTNNKNVTAVAGNVKVGNEKNILTKWQSIEYTTAQNFDRRAFDYLNCITVVPGAIGAFKKSAVIEAGGFTTDTLAEDCDLTIRLLRQGGTIRNCPKAVAITEAPETIKQFMKQRFRWNYGIMQSFWKNKDACFNPRYKALAMVALPNILLFQMLMTIFAPLADLLFFFSIAWSWHDAESLQKLLLFYGLFLLVDVMVSIMAFSFEKEKFYKLVWLIPQRFVYRQLMYVVLFRSIAKAIKGEVQGWGVLKRT